MKNSLREIPSRETYKLEAIRSVLLKLKRPELGRKTILVAGTNGKGSVVQYLTNLFLGTSLRVGTYISPHVVERRERIRIHGRCISEKTLRDYEKRYEKYLRELSYFERMTTLAFLIFRDRRCDLQILEVGMGGRLDATNCSEPDLSVVTHIDYDHQEILGNSLTKIASEKAGILRKGRPVFIAPQSDEALQELRRQVIRKGAFFGEAAVDEQELRDRRWKSVLHWIQRERGSHQVDNARVAARAFLWAHRMWNLAGSGAERARYLKAPLPVARIQILSRRPLQIVDGAHNSDSVAALTNYLQKHHPRTKFEIIFGAMVDKDVNDMLSRLRPWAKRFYFPRFYPERQISPEALVQQIVKPLERQVSGGTVEIASHHQLKAVMSPYVGRLLKQCRGPLLCVGSLYLAGAFLRARKRVKTKP